MSNQNSKNKQKEKENNITDEKNNIKKNTPNNIMIEEEDGIRAIGGA